MRLDLLNPPQREAVLHEGGPLVVFAGAGSGKTRVITHRVERLVAEKDVKPWRILAVTFTNKAAGEMRARLEKLVPGKAKDLWVGTFHATCARLLRRYAEPLGIKKDFNIYDDSDQKSVLTRLCREWKLDERRYAPKQLAGEINRAKQEVLGPDEYPSNDPYSETVGRVYAEYEKTMRRAGALDFGDLIYQLVVALEKEPGFREEVAGRFSHVLVDEFQDTNHAQYRLVRALTARHESVCVVGDDDQSIYRWRGADRRNILDFTKDYPNAHVVKLEQNYRSTKRILRVANAIIEKNHDREPKRLWTDNEQGPKILVVRCADERDESRVVLRAVEELCAEGKALGDIALFYRTHAQSRVLEEALRAANLPYVVVGGVRFYDRAEVKDLLAYMRLVHNPGDDVSLARIVNTPARGIGKTTMDRLAEAAARVGIGLFEAMERIVRGATPGDDFGIGPATRKKLAVFHALLVKMREQAAEATSVDTIGRMVLDESGYIEALEKEDSPEAESRIENLRELVGSMEELASEGVATLPEFLEHVSLQTSADEGAAGADPSARLTLMTVHAAKGLEFPAVIVTGLEEGMFPMRGIEVFEDPEELEEERRLAYVAFTRAEERLILTWATVRRIYGQMRTSMASRFVQELPREDVHTVGNAPTVREVFDGRVGASRWNRPSGPYGHDDRPSIPNGEYVDRTEGSDLELEMLAPGARVRHPQFGVGRVMAITDGVPPRVRVRFEGGVEKAIVASYLEPV